MHGIDSRLQLVWPRLVTFQAPAHDRVPLIDGAPIRTVRELTRYRKTLVQQRTDEANLLHKTLAGANLKLAMVVVVVVTVVGVTSWG
jgi:hypothetical protein